MNALLLIVERSIVGTIELARRHPFFVIAVVILFLILPFVKALSTFHRYVRAALAWCEGYQLDGKEVLCRPCKVIRKLILFAVLALVPGTLFAYLAFKLASWWKLEGQKEARGTPTIDIAPPTDSTGTNAEPPAVASDNPWLWNWNA
jgi:hypothetical protein